MAATDRIIPGVGTLPLMEHTPIDDRTGNKRTEIWGFDGTNWNRAIVDSSNALKTSGGGAGGTVNQGTGGASAWLMKISQTTSDNDVDVLTLPSLIAGSAIIGKVGIDQTTPGTTNKVSIGSDGTVGLLGGSATIGKVDQGTGGVSAWKVDGSAVTQPVSGTVTANVGTTGGLALDGTLTGGTAKEIVRGGQKGTTNTNADITHTPSGANHELLDIGLYDASGNQIGLAATPVRTDPTGTTTQPVSGTVALGAGSATIGKVDQGTGGASAWKVDGSAVTQPVSGTVTANQGSAGAGAWPIKISQTTTDNDVDVLTLPAVTNAGTFAVQDSQVIVDNAPFTDGVSKLFMDGFILDETAGPALTENDAAAARIDSKRAQVFVIEDETTRGRRATVTAAKALVVDGSAVTQPVSIAATVTVDTELPAAAALADGSSNPTTPLTGSCHEEFNGTTWDRTRHSFTQTTTGITTNQNGATLDLTKTPCNNFTAVAIVTASTGAYKLTLQGSIDGTNFLNEASTSITGNGNAQLHVVGHPWLYVRYNISNISGVTLTVSILATR